MMRWDLVPKDKEEVDKLFIYYDKFGVEWKGNIDGIRDKFFGRCAIDLDIDRQKVTVFGTPADCEALIREEVTKLSSPAGGLMMIYGCYPGTPLENVKALLDAMEKYTYYWD